MSKFGKLLVSALSAGWLVPLWLAASFYADYLQQDLRPQIQGHAPLTSFPLLDFSSACFAIACIWLALVIVFWSYRGLSRFS